MYKSSRLISVNGYGTHIRLKISSSSPGEVRNHLGQQKCGLRLSTTELSKVPCPTLAHTELNKESILGKKFPIHYYQKLNSL